MDDLQKLRILVPHWIEHNGEHAEEFREWAEKAGDVGGDVLAAADLLGQANRHLQTALDRLGGPREPPHGHHHHHHHHHE